MALHFYDCGANRAFTAQAFIGMFVPMLLRARPNDPWLNEGFVVHSFEPNHKLRGYFSNFTGESSKYLRELGNWKKKKRKALMRASGGKTMPYVATPADASFAVGSQGALCKANGRRAKKGRCISRGVPPVIRGVRNFTLVEAAVWTADTTLTFNLGTSDDASTLMSDKTSGKKGSLFMPTTMSVPALDFSRFLARTSRPGDFVVLKLDIEGAEYDVLERLVRDGILSRVSLLFIEWHGSKMSNEESYRARERSLQAAIRQNVGAADVPWEAAEWLGRHAHAGDNSGRDARLQRSLEVAMDALKHSYDMWRKAKGRKPGSYRPRRRPF